MAGPKVKDIYYLQSSKQNPPPQDCKSKRGAIQSIFDLIELHFDNLDTALNNFETQMHFETASKISENHKKGFLDSISGFILGATRLIFAPKVIASTSIFLTFQKGLHDTQSKYSGGKVNIKLRDFIVDLRNSIGDSRNAFFKMRVSLKQKILSSKIKLEDLCDEYIELYNNFRSHRELIINLFEIWINSTNETGLSYRLSDKVGFSYQGKVIITIDMKTRKITEAIIDCPKGGKIAEYLKRHNSDYKIYKLNVKRMVRFKHRKTVAILLDEKGNDKSHILPAMADTTSNLARIGRQKFRLILNGKERSLENPKIIKGK